MYPKTSAVRAHRDEIDRVVFGVRQDLRIRLAILHGMFHAGPQMDFGRHCILEAAGSLMVGRVGVVHPRNLRLPNNWGRQHVQHVQPGLILLRERHCILEREL